MLLWSRWAGETEQIRREFHKKEKSIDDKLTEESVEKQMNDSRLNRHGKGKERSLKRSSLAN